MSGHTDNRIVIDAPLDIVWRMTNDVASWPQLFTEYAAAEILEQTEDMVRFRLTKHPDENGTVWSWVSERHLDAEAREVLAHRVETGPFEFMRIRWSYREVEGGTEMRWVQHFRMKPTAPVDDAEMTRRIDAGTAEQMPHIKQLVEAEARRLAGAAA